MKIAEAVAVSSKKSAVQRTIEYLQQMPNDELLTTQELEAKLHVNTRTGHFKSTGLLDTYKTKANVINRPTFLWGNERAVRAYIRKVEAVNAPSTTLQ